MYAKPYHFHLQAMTLSVPSLYIWSATTLHDPAGKGGLIILEFLRIVCSHMVRLRTMSVG